MIRTLLILALVSAAVPVAAGRLQRMHEAVALEQDFDRSLSRSYDQVNFTAHGITGIAIEREQPEGGGLSYSAFLYADGTIRFAGVRHPERVGLFEGRTTRWQFDALAHYILAMDYFDLQHTYTGSDLDGSAVFTSVVRDETRKVVRNDSRAGPPELWALEQLIDKLLGDATWRRTGDLEEKDH